MAHYYTEKVEAGCFVAKNMLRKSYLSMNETGQDQQSLEKINIPIEWHVSDSIRSQYVTNVVVQAGQNEVFISLFETQVPMLMGTPEENSAKLKSLGGIKAECVGRIVVAPELVPNIINALQVGLDNYTAQKKALKED
jgi:hypothetical protein